MGTGRQDQAQGDKGDRMKLPQTKAGYNQIGTPQDAQKYDERECLTVQMRTSLSLLRKIATRILRLRSGQVCGLGGFTQIFVERFGKSLLDSNADPSTALRTSLQIGQISTDLS
jgi:hypothetical protein